MQVEVVPAPIPSPTLLATLPDYAELYPKLFIEPSGRASIYKEKVVYLTFDDGPSDRTPEILDILDKNEIKATFFVVGKEDEASAGVMRRIVDEGHTLGMHSYSHDYRTVYESVESCLADYDRLFHLIKDTTGIEPQILRFPGGSINGYNTAIYQQTIAEMTRRGFAYFDWNVATGDAVGATGPAVQRKNALKDCSYLRRAVVLMHDSGDKNGTVEALQAIIDGYKDAGFTFAALTPEVVPVVFSYAE